MRLLLIITLATLIYLALKRLTAANGRPEARPRAPKGRNLVEPPDLLVFINDQFFLASPDERQMIGHLAELESVAVLTSDLGPFDDDVYLALDFGGPVWLVPISHPHYKDFYDALTRRLPLNYEIYLKAVLSTDNNIFLIWSRPDGFLKLELPDSPNSPPH